MAARGGTAEERIRSASWREPSRSGGVELGRVSLVRVAERESGRVSGGASACRCCCRLEWQSGEKWRTRARGRT